MHASPKALGKPCELCHTDHKGRNKDILGFATFGGQEQLRPQHAHAVPARGQAPDDQVQGLPQAEDARRARITYLKAPTACAGCHNNPHGDLHEKHAQLRDAATTPRRGT